MKLHVSSPIKGTLHPEGEQTFYLHTDLERNNVLDIYCLIDE